MATQAQSTPSDKALERVLASVREHGLEENLIELETKGYTTLHGVLSEEQMSRARDAIVARVERTTGKKIDIHTETGENLTGLNYIPYMLYDDEVFEGIMMEPRPLTLLTWLLGESCVLSSLGCHFKGPGGTPLPLHSDNGNGIPGPYGPVAQVANANYALTPYSREAGALALVPGSHKLGRQPRADEMMLSSDSANPNAECQDLSPGDCVVWHGNTWHGSFDRTIPGVRMNLAVYCNRQHIVTQERHKDVVPEEVLARHADDKRFQVMLGGKQPYGWQQDGPDYSRMMQSPRGLYD